MSKAHIGNLSRLGSQAGPLPSLGVCDNIPVMKILLVSKRNAISAEDHNKLADDLRAVGYEVVSVQSSPQSDIHDVKVVPLPEPKRFTFWSLFARQREA